MTDIKIDSEFDKKFSVKGTDERTIVEILDSTIRSKMMKIRDFNLVIGVDKILDAYNQSQTAKGVESTLSALSVQIALEHRVRKGLESNRAYFLTL